MYFSMYFPLFCLDNKETSPFWSYARRCSSHIVSELCYQILVHCLYFLLFVFLLHEHCIYGVFMFFKQFCLTSPKEISQIMCVLMPCKKTINGKKAMKLFFGQF